MFESVTLDQLRALVAVVEEGSFSAAARKLRRVQSAISTQMANLEEHLGVTLWDRRTKVAKLTEEGRAVLAAARRVLLEVDGLKRLTAEMSAGVEASVSLCVDAIFPESALLDVCVRFANRFPAVDLRVDIEVMSAVSARVLRGGASLGIVSPVGLHPGLARKPIGSVTMVPVVGPSHPLAAAKGPISSGRLLDAVQIVLSERAERGGVSDQGVLSPRTWRVADLHTKHAMIRANLGWGNLPEHLVADDLARRALVAIRPEAWSEEGNRLVLYAVSPADAVFGPAHRWLIDELEARCADATEPRGSTGRRPRAHRKR